MRATFFIHLHTKTGTPRAGSPFVVLEEGGDGSRSAFIFFNLKMGIINVNLQCMVEFTFERRYIIGSGYAESTTN